jgi:hypothetical protein
LCTTQETRHPWYRTTNAGLGAGLAVSNIAVVVLLGWDAAYPFVAYALLGVAVLDAVAILTLVARGLEAVVGVLNRR